MQLLIDALSARVGGTLSYISNQLEGLVRVRPTWSISVLVAPWNERAIRKIEGLCIRPVAVDSLTARLAFEQLILPLRVGRGVDVVYCPANFVPLAMKRPTVLAQHNANYFGHGRLLAKERGGIRSRAEIALARLSLLRADAVVVISESLRAEMERDNAWSEKCTVILAGAPPPEKAPTRPPSLHLGKSFLLSVANDYPHKRLDDLVRAWSGLTAADPPSLVMVGTISPQRIEHHRALVPADRRPLLIHMGTMDERAQVWWLLEHALALVITSELEAFPLTPAEAGHVGCPLVLTDIPPHREVTAGRGTYFQVGDIDGLRARLVELWERPVERQPWEWPHTWEQYAERLATLLESFTK
jgi:glycosyltransferase involved in cell wall biosynthesis